MFEKMFENKTCEFYARQPEKLSPRGSNYKSPVVHPQPQARNRTAPKCQDTIIQVDPGDMVQEKHKHKTVANTSQYSVHSFHNLTVHAEVHNLPTVAD